MIIVQVSNFIEFKWTLSAETTKFCLDNFHVILPNATKYTTKLENKILSYKTEALV